MLEWPGLPDVLPAIVGAAALLAALLPRLVQGRRPVSLPIVVLLVGLAVGAVLSVVPGAPSVDPVEHAKFVEHLTEVTVIIALMGAGLGLDRPPGWRRWQTTWRLLGIAMPLTILVVAVSGSLLLGLAPAAAVLLGAALSPTDPVLAGEVQVGEPRTDPVEGDELDAAEEEVRFGLTSEAGLNDALAFPFVYLAVFLAERGTGVGDWVGEWLAVSVLFKLAVGVLGGVLVGRLVARLAFSARRQELRLSEHSEGFVAVAVTFLAYGLTELVQGYGFVAVFVAAVVIRGSERFSEYHLVLHTFIEQIERLLTVLVLLLLGAAISGGLLSTIGWGEVLLAALVLLVVRPLVAGLSLAGSCGTRGQRAAIAFFGVRGIGSLYYVAYAMGAATITGAEEVLAVVALVVAGSVLLHGVSAGPVLDRLDRRLAEPEPEPAATPSR